jgi:hypothetical protein
MPSKEIVLTLSDVEQSLCAFESKYHVSTEEFLRNQAMRAGLPEDEVLLWEAFVDHRNELQALNQEVHREYLNQLGTASTEAPAAPKPEDKLLLAA